MDRDYAVIWSVFILIISGMCCLALTVQDEVVEINIFEVYTMTAPFGFFTVKGEMGGGVFSFYGYISGSENYDVKYMDNDILKTLILNAEETDIVIDGTLSVEQQRVSHWGYFLFLKWEIRWKYNYVIHIPYLPEHETMTEDWIK